VCREVLCVSHVKQCASAVLSSWATPAPGLGAQEEPSLLPAEQGSTPSPNTKCGDGQAQASAHPSLGNHGNPCPTFRSLWAAWGLAIGSASLAHLGTCQAFTHP